MTRTVNANSIKIVPEDSEEGILLSVSQDGKLATNKIDNQGNVDNQASALTSNFISLTDTPEAFQAEKYLKVNAQGNALEFSDISISTNFISLTDTPNAFKAGSYLRVNTAGDAIEQIKTAPPDGGIGDNSEVQMYSNFAGKLPDSIIAKSATGQIVMGRFYHINSPNEDGDIHYSFNEFGGNQYMAFFKNDPTGTNARFSSVASSWQFFDGATTLQDVIDSGNAIYHGQKGGSSGVGRLSYWKQTYGTPKGSNNVSWKFMHDLPDAIVTKDGDGAGGYWDSPFTISEIGYPDPDNPTSIDVYYRNQAGNTYYIVFNLNTVDGDYRTSSKVDLTELTGSTPSLADYIQGGRALYYGAPHGDSVKTGTYISDGTTTQQINLGFRPKMVTIKGVRTTDSDATYTGTNYFYDQTVFDTISESGDFIPRPYRATDSRLIGHVDANERVEIEINDTGFKIIGPSDGTLANNSGANMLGAKYHYFAIGPDVSVSGDGASSVEQLTDVDVATTPPSAGQVLVYDDTDSKWKPGAQSTDFTDLTDTPGSLDAGSYLRVNSTGDAIEQIKTAPPDGGIGDSSRIQAVSNFASKIPDYLVLKHSSSDTSTVIAELRFIGDSTITYKDVSYDTYYVNFNNNPAGDGWTKNANHLQSPIDGVAAPTLQQLIDGGHVVYLGQKSGTSGAGSLSYLKSLANSSANGGFYTELPDAIVSEYSSDTNNGVFKLHQVTPSATVGGTGWEVVYRMEAFSSGDYYMGYRLDADGTLVEHAKVTHANPTTKNLRWYIENGRALYHGSDPVTSRIGQLEDIKSVVPLANEIDIPDAIVVTNSSGAYIKLPLAVATGSVLGYDYNNGSGTRWYISFSSTNGAHMSNAADANVVKEYSSLQDYISNGRALFYGRTGSNLDQLVGDINDLSDVDTSTVTPSAGQVLVYDDTDSKWKPGAQSTDFTDLTDTPSSLDAGSYLRVNTTGDAIEQIKTAPPDGGVGDNSLIQAASNFDGKLPDAIIHDHGEGKYVLTLQFIGENIGYRYEDFGDATDHDRRIIFNNDASGTLNGDIFFTAAGSLRWYIDNARAIYHGQKSGTSGVGSLSYLKSLANSSPNGGFYTELPDTIVSEYNSDTYNGIFKLHWVKPNVTAGGTNWEVLYRAEAFSTTIDYYMGYLLDADGTKVVHSGVTHANPTTKNLRWYIENGRAIYNGGYNESNVVSARIAADGTTLSSNYDWIQSVNRYGIGNYLVTFKPGHFTSTPALSLGVDHAGGVSHVTVEFDNPTTTGCRIYTRQNKGGQEGQNVDANFTIMAQHQDRPIGLAATQYSIKAWGVFDGTQGSGNNYNITGFTGGNVASIVRINDGLYKVTFINPMLHADYSISGSCNPHGTGGSYFGVREYLNPVTATDFHIELRDATNGFRNSDRISFQVVC